MMTREYNCVNTNPNRRPHPILRHSTLVSNHSLDQMIQKSAMTTKCNQTNLTYIISEEEDLVVMEVEYL